MIRQRSRGNRVDLFLHLGTRSRCAGEPLTQRFGLAGVDDGEGVAHMGTEPRHHRLQRAAGFVFVDRPPFARRRLACKGGCPGIRTELGCEVVAGLVEPEEDLVGFRLVFELWWVVGLEEVDVVVAGRLGCGPLVGGAHEQVADTHDVLLRPRKLVLPDAVSRHVWRIPQAQELLESLVVRLVQLGVVQRSSPLGDELVVVDVLLDVEVDLAVVRVLGDELAAHGADDLGDHGVDGGLQEEGIQLGKTLGQKAEVVAEFGAGCTDREVDISGGEPVNGESVDDPLGGWLVLRGRKRSLDPIPELVRHFQDAPHLVDCVEAGVVGQALSVAVIRHQSRSVLRHIGFEHAADLAGKGLEDLPFLDDGELFELVQVCRMDREQVDEPVQVLSHSLVERREPLEVVFDR